MELFMPNVFLYGGCLVAAVFLLGAIGMLVMRLMPEWRGGDNTFLTLFNAVAIGLTVVVPLFAVVWARGNSIMWIAVLLWGYYFLRTRKKPDTLHVAEKGKMDLTTVITALVALVGVYALFYWLFFVRSGGSLCGDHVYYANVSCLMIDEHVESGRYQSLFRFPAPYHYGDSWFTSLWSLVFGLKPIYVLYSMTYPFFFYMIVLGIAALCVEISSSNKVVALVLGMVFMFYKPIMAVVIPWQSTTFPTPKLYIVTFFMVWCALMFMKGDFRRAFISLVFSVPFYSTVSAGVLSFVFLMGIFWKWKETSGWRRWLNEYTIVAIGVALFYGTFYFLQQKSPVAKIEETYNYGDMVVKALLYALRWTSKSCILLLPSFAVMLYLGKRNPIVGNKGWLLVVSVAISCGITILLGGFWQQMSRDGIQLMTNYVDSARNVCAFSAMLLLIEHITSRFYPRVRYLVWSVLLFFPLCFAKKGVVGSWFWPSHDPYTQLETAGLDELKGKDALFGVFRVFDIEGPVQYFAFDDFDMIPHFLRTGYFCFYELSELELPEGFPARNNDSHSHAFVEYVTLQKRDGKFVSNEQSMLDFVRFMGIEYLFVESRSELPEIFEDKVVQVADRNGSVLYRVVS